jgi:type III secretory pathway lipoprotein EscJ
VDGERAAVLDAATRAATSLGFTVTRINETSGKISSARRQTAGLGDARQETLEAQVTQLAPGVMQVSVVLRETVESGDGSDAGPMVSSGLIRNRAPYDAFFKRLNESLSPSP